MKTFTEFWPFYLREHSRPVTRRLHFAGTSLATLALLLAAALRRWELALAAPLFGYSFAWVSHFALEKNRPATFKHPLWSFAADYRMLGYAALGKLDEQLRRAGVASQSP